MFCCDYDALTTYEPGSFCSQHRTDLTGRIERVNLNAITDMDDLNSFLNQSYESYITTAPLILYRAFGAVKKDSGKIAGAWATGRFISTEFADQSGLTQKCMRKNCSFLPGQNFILESLRR